MKTSLKQINQAILQGLKANYGDHVEMGVKFEINPAQVQTFEEKKRQQFAFLNDISFFGTTDKTGQIITFTDSDIVDQSRKSGGRAPVKTYGLGDRQFNTRNIDQDVALSWAEQVQWGSQKAEFYGLWRTMCLRRRARGVLRVGFYGQAYLPSNNSDLSAYPMGEDVQRGWLQYMLENHPENVLGIVKDNVDGTIIAANGDKYKVAPINIGSPKDANGDPIAGSDYASLADLAQAMKDKIEIVYRGDTGIKLIAGDSLRSKERRVLVSAAANKATEIAATEAMLAMNQVANMTVVTPDEFPVSGLMVTNPKNLQYVYQTNSVYRTFREWDDTKETQDLLTMDRDFVIPFPEATVMVHPDAPRYHNGTAWVEYPGAVEWSIV